MRIDLNAAVTWDATRDAGSAFLRWWASELLGLVPNSWRRRAAILFKRYVLKFEEKSWSLAVNGELEIQLDPAAPGDELRDLIARIEPRALVERIEVQIPASEILVRRIQLNAGARSRLRSAVRLQLERLFPFRGDDVAFDCHELDHSDNEMLVEIAVVPLQRLNAIQERLEKIGLHLGRFTVSDTPIQFLPPRVGWTKQERLQLWLGSAAVVALVAAIAIVPLLREVELQSLDDEIAQLRAPARQAAAIREEWEHLRDPLAAVFERLGRPSDLDLLKALTNALPDNVQLSSLSIDSATVHIEGVAPSAKHMAELLGYVHAFSGVRLLNHSKTARGEYFSIILSLSESESGT